MALFKYSNCLPHSFTNNDIILYDNVFSEIDCNSIRNYLKKPNWQWGHTSKDITEETKNTPLFWCMNLISERFFSEYLFNKIKEITGNDLKLLRCYANGNSFGLPGDIHQDSNIELATTFMFYANQIWEPRFGGKTAFLFEDETENKYIMPKNNRGVYFPSLIPHYAEEVTRLYSGLRQVVVWKMEKN
jgi:hypothetical protein